MFFLLGSFGMVPLIGGSSLAVPALLTDGVS
jgi:hypothetical protein